MSASLHTAHLELLPRTRAEVLADVAGMPEDGLVWRFEKRK